MFSRLIEIALPRIIGVMVHKREKLTAKEERAQKAFVSNLKYASRKTKEPVIVAMIGLIGSGKSSVATELAKHIGATVVSGDGIRIELRKQGERYEKMRAMRKRGSRKWQMWRQNSVSDKILKGNPPLCLCFPFFFITFSFKGHLYHN